MWNKIMTMKIPKGKILCWWSSGKVELVTNAELIRRSTHLKPLTKIKG